MIIIRFLNAHKTKIVGLLLAALGSVQANSGAIQSIISPQHFAYLTIGAGVLVAILGFINSSA